MRAVVVLLVVACGRVSFDARSDAGLPDIALDAALDAAAPDPTLIARYSFDDTPADGAHDDTGNGNLALCTVGCPGLVPGRIGNAYAFDGVDDGINIPDVRPASTTVSAWLFRTSAVVSQSIIGRPFGPGTQNTYQLVIAAGSRLFMLATESMPVAVLADSGVVIDVDRWYHIAFVSNQTSVRAYLDGVEFGGQPLAMAYDNHNTYVGVDVDSGSYTGYFTGLVDEVRIYARALSATEIQRLAMGLEP